MMILYEKVKNKVNNYQCGLIIFYQFSFIIFSGDRVMISYLIYGFLYGAAIPFMARRFAKFMPATPANALWQLIKINRFLPQVYSCKEFKRFAWRSFMSAVIVAILTYLFAAVLGGGNTGWSIFFLWTLLLLAEIDWRMYLLPDILTVPLLIGGFAYSGLGNGWIIPAESSLGTIVGYFLPVIIGFLLLPRNKNAFGGGDIKLLAAIGAWVGIVPLLYVISSASVLMLLYTLLSGRKEVAFGPALALSAIGVAILFF